MGVKLWSLILREKHTCRLRASENGAEENIWIEEDEVTGGWRQLHNEELHNLYSSPSIIRVITSKRRYGQGM
jgi:hypothetical protein